MFKEMVRLIDGNRVGFDDRKFLYVREGHVMNIYFQDSLETPAHRRRSFGPGSSKHKGNSTLDLI